MRQAVHACTENVTVDISRLCTALDSRVQYIEKYIALKQFGITACRLDQATVFFILLAASVLRGHYSLPTLFFLLLPSFDILFGNNGFFFVSFFLVPAP